MAAIVSPRTWADLDPLNTTNLNAGIRDAILQLLPIRAFKNSDQGVSNATTGTTLVNDAGLIVPVAASAEYEIAGLLKYTAAGGSGAGQFKIGWTAPTSATFDWLGIGLVVNGTAGTTGSIAMDASIVSDARSYGAAGTGTAAMVRITGRLATSVTPGNLQLQFAQVTASASSTTMKLGSFLVARQIA